MVVHGLSGAEFANEVELGAARHSCDLRPECDRELGRVGADAPGGTEDEHSLSGADPPHIGQRLQGGDARHGRSCGLLEPQRRWLVGELGLVGRCVLGVGAVADPEDRVAHLETGDLVAHSLHDARDVEAQDRLLGPSQAEAGEPYRVRQPGGEMPDPSIDSRSCDAQQHLAGTRCRSVDDGHLGRVPVAIPDGCRHGVGRSGGRRAARLEVGVGGGHGFSSKNGETY